MIPWTTSGSHRTTTARQAQRSANAVALGGRSRRGCRLPRCLHCSTPRKWITQPARSCKPPYGNGRRAAPIMGPFFFLEPQVPASSCEMSQDSSERMLVCGRHVSTSLPRGHQAHGGLQDGASCRYPLPWGAAVQAPRAVCNHGSSVRPRVRRHSKHWASSGVVRFDESQKSLPRDHRVHLGQQSARGASLCPWHSTAPANVPCFINPCAPRSLQIA